jgi:anaerobic magnesium-protoporphyrin IX monomethyl ester cyclase
MKLIDRKIERVVLINPNFITKSITDTFTIPALGLESIAANILDLAEVKIINGKVRNLTVEQIMKEINSFRPDVVGISCCFTIGVNFALRVAKKSKEKGYVIILGGWHPHFLHSDLLKYPFIDIIVRGEGEITFRELMKNKDLEEIKGISYKINGSIIDNPDRPLITDLDKLPLPARKLRNTKSYFQYFQMPIDAIETSRGCPHKCTFCNIHLFNRGTYRTKSTERVIEELKLIIGLKKCKDVLIVDDNFTANIFRVERICDKIIREGMKLHLICQSRIDVITKHPEVIKKMSQAGFWLFFLGIESFNQGFLDGVQKKVQFKDILKAIKILHDNNILIIGSMLIGSNFDEEEKDTDKMIKVVKRIGIDFPIYSIMTPLPGTRFRDVVIERGFLLSHNWSEYNFTTAVNRLNNLSKEQLERSLAKAYYYGYFHRGWKDTFLRIYRKKGVKFIINSRKHALNALWEFIIFFRNIGKMKEAFDSRSSPSAAKDINIFYK